MACFNEIPYEVFMEYLLPLLSMAEVGSLTMTCTIWRDMCDENEVWKHLYMRTIRAKILDTSVHIGACFERYRDVRGERRSGTKPLFYKIHPVTTIIAQNPGVTMFPVRSSGRTSWWARDSSELIRNHPCLKCTANADFVSTLKSWREVRDDGVDNDDFEVLPNQTLWGWTKRDCYPYLTYIEDAWINYNKEKGLSTTSLCQCPEHYSFETLGLPSGCRNYKSFKKMTLKKEKTKADKQSKKASKEYEKKRREYEAAMRVVQRAEKEMTIAKEVNEKACRLCNNLDNVPGVKKVKKPIVGIAHPNPNITWWYMGAKRRQEEHSEATE